MARTMVNKQAHADDGGDEPALVELQVVNG